MKGQETGFQLRDSGYQRQQNAWKEFTVELHEMVECGAHVFYGSHVALALPSWPARGKHSGGYDGYGMISPF